MKRQRKCGKPDPSEVRGTPIVVGRCLERNVPQGCGETYTVLVSVKDEETGEVSQREETISREAF